MAEHSVPIGLHILDFALGALVFAHHHIIFLAFILLSYYVMNSVLYFFFNHSIYSKEVLDWEDIHSIIRIAIHVILTLLIYYILCLITSCRHQSFTKRVSRRRLNLRQH